LQQLRKWCEPGSHAPGKCCKGRAIAQAVSLWLPTAAARVQTRV
jgi:hypothetical protein